MFTKLLKHEWRDSSRILTIFSLAALGAGAAAGVMLRLMSQNANRLAEDPESGWITAVLAIVMVFVVFGLMAYVLGSRILLAGDILTAQQVAQMTFSPLHQETDAIAQVGYLPIYEDRVAQQDRMTISIRGKEDKPPVAEDSSAETYKNLPATAKLKATDPEDQSMTFTVIRQPRRGTVTIAEDGSFTYTPKKNKVGIDSFTYTATDPAGKVSREATVTVTILKPTDAPQYTDTAGRECRFAAEWMKHTGIFVGENLADNPCFSPDKEVTRGEFVTMLVKALEIPTEDTVSYTGYDDEIPKWLQPYLAAALRSGLTEGLQQETFGADQSITTAEASLLLQNALDRNADLTVFSETEADTLLTRETAALALYEAAKLAGIDFPVLS